MKKTTKKRWVCPTCNTGILAPSKLRKMDSRRYCLKCSAKSTLLVERACPSREATASKKAKARNRSAEKRLATIKANRDAQPYRLRKDLIRIDFEKLRKMPCWPVRIPKSIVLGIHHSLALGTSGHCWGRYRIHITTGRNVTRERIIEVLVHELAHAAALGHHHDDIFKSVEQDGLIEARERGILPTDHKPQKVYPG